LRLQTLKSNKEYIPNLAWDEGVARSNRVIPTILKDWLLSIFFCYLSVCHNYIVAPCTPF